MESDVTPGNGISLGDYLGVFTRRGWLVVVPFVLVLSVATALGFLLPPRFQASTRVKVDDLKFLERFHQRGGFDVPYKPFLATIGADIRRRRFLEGPVKEYGVSEGYDYQDPHQRQQLFTFVIDHLSITYKDNKLGPDIFGITYEGRDAPRVARFVNAIRQKYMEDINERLVRVVAQAKAIQTQRYLDDQRSLQAAIKARESFQRRSDAALGGDKVLAAKQATLDETRIKLAEGEGHLASAEKQLDLVLNERKNTDTVSVSETQERNPDYVAAAAKVAELQAKLKSLQKDYTDFLPQVQTAKTDLELAREVLEGIPPFSPRSRTATDNPTFTSLNLQVQSLQQQIAALKSEVLRRRKLVATLSGQIRRIPGIRAQVSALETQRETAANNLLRSASLLADAEATFDRVTSKEGSVFTVLSAPTPEEARTWDPIFPNVGLFIGAGALVGLLLGAGLAFIVEFSNQTFVTANQVRRLLPVPLLGQVQAIRTAQEHRTRVRRRLIVGTVSALILGVLVWVHVAYFSKGLQEKLPPAIFDIMKRIYGSR